MGSASVRLGAGYPARLSPTVTASVSDTRPAWILFADIDGTLWCGGERRVVLRERIRRAMEVARVVLASSRTIEEILKFEARLGVETDFLAENGAQVAVRDPRVAAALGGCEPTPGLAGSLWVRHLAAPLREVLPAVVDAANQHGIASLLQGTPGWPGSGSSNAPPFRRASLLLPRAMLDDGRLAGFAADVVARGLELVPGGEWTAISRGASKGRAATTYAEALRQAIGGALRTAAVGNSDNDASLLEAVDRGFVIRNPDGHTAKLARIPKAMLLTRLGCAGWSQVVAQLRKAADG